MTRQVQKATIRPESLLEGFVPSEIVEQRDSYRDYRIRRIQAVPTSVLVAAAILPFGVFAAELFLNVVEEGRWEILTPDFWPWMMPVLLGVLGFSALLVGFAWSIACSVRISRAKGILRYGWRTYPLAELSLPRRYRMRVNQQHVGDQPVRVYEVVEVTLGTGERLTMFDKPISRWLWDRKDEVAAELNDAILWQQRYDAAQALLRGAAARSDGLPYRRQGNSSREEDER